MHSWRANVSLTVVAMLTIILGSTTVGYGQGVATATVSGRIEDSSGAAINGATKP